MDLKKTYLLVHNDNNCRFLTSLLLQLLFLHYFAYGRINDMSKILEFLQETTNGKPYKSFKFCYDTIEVPKVSYEEDPIPLRELKEYGETDSSLKSSKSLVNLANSLQDSKPLFSYFIDGSRKVYKVDDIEYGRKIYPIIAGQIGIGCCQRINLNKFSKVVLESNLVMALPSTSYADGHNPELFYNRLVDKINDLDGLKRFNLKFSKILTYASKITAEEKYENLGIACIQDEMIECEKKVVAYLASKNLLNLDNYLLKDGSLQYKPMKTGDFRELSKIRKNYQCVVGVSKLFNPELCKDKQGRSNANVIAKLPLFHRTPAFMYQNSEILGDVKFSIWYVRIRDIKYTDSPFSGIVKVEKILVSNEEMENGLSSDEVDLISANIVNERNPVCYGSDNRWANHLYPVYLTEKYIKSKYISDYHFLNLF